MGLPDLGRAVHVGLAGIMSRAFIPCLQWQLIERAATAVYGVNWQKRLAGDLGLPVRALKTFAQFPPEPDHKVWALLSVAISARADMLMGLHFELLEASYDPHQIRPARAAPTLSRLEGLGD
jgi:hypothetical protein